MKFEFFVLLFCIAIIVLLGYIKITTDNSKNDAIQRQQQLEQQKEKDKQENIDLCIIESSRRYSTNWDESCKTYGVDKKIESCSLPMYIAESLEKSYASDKTDCINRYK